ncbi:dihydroneopterin aldolase [Moheibacter lacus]|uniref:7,8-dihydroneopterin aldolase n=1 Tax=Moheibacter lacus TaxID=2745851 RepID=A0A838ZMX0_9FLAO|nr:dihydroneopterin aldolase [Moheibacter lacus]MBA5629190.1 dihydroneopterin aldolase [Moheibacter lacus]
MGKIILENIRIYSNHGCLDEEALIGSDYVVDLEIEADLSKSAETDELGDTVDYVHLNRIVKEEVSIRSKLLEKVADRVLQRIGKEIFMVRFARVKLSKMNPPIGGNVEKVSIILEKKFSV